MMNTLNAQQKAGFFKLGEYYFALDQHFLRQIVSVPKITPVPRSKGGLLGLIAIRGDIFPLIDLAKLYDLGTLHLQSLDLALLLEYQSQIFALCIDEMLGIFPYQLPDVSEVHVFQQMGKSLGDTRQTLLLDLSVLVNKLDQYLVVA